MNRGSATATARRPAAKRPADSSRSAAGAAGGAGEICPHFHAAIELIGKRWSGAILRALSMEPMRFAQLAKCIPGLSDRLLSERLRELEATGLVDREVTEGSPVKVVYRLTRQGSELAPVLDDLRDWARRWKRAG